MLPKVGGEDKLGNLVTEFGEYLISGLERSPALLEKVKDEDRLVNLHSFSTSSFEFGKEMLIDWKKIVEEVNRLDGLVAVSLAKVEEAHRASDDKTSLNASLLSLVEVGEDLGGLDKLEGLSAL